MPFDIMIISVYDNARIKRPIFNLNGRLNEHVQPFKNEFNFVNPW